MCLSFTLEVGTHTRLSEARVSTFDNGLPTGVTAEAAQVHGGCAVLEGYIVRIGMGHVKRCKYAHWRWFPGPGTQTGTEGITGKLSSSDWIENSRHAAEVSRDMSEDTSMSFSMFDVSCVCGNAS